MSAAPLMRGDRRDGLDRADAEHLVDVVVQFEGERHSRLRMVRAVKNRFGPADEVGCFDLSDVGIVGLPDRNAGHVGEEIPGSCLHGASVPSGAGLPQVSWTTRLCATSQADSAKCLILA